MKVRILALGAIAGSAAVFFSGIFQQKDDQIQAHYKPRSEQNTSYNSAIVGAQQYIASIRGDMNTGVVDPEVYQKALNQARQHQASRAGALGLQFGPMGPANIGGRTRAFVIDNEDPNRLYIGSVSGGIFVSTNGGNSWTTNFDNQGWIGISTMTQSSDGVLFAGTGSDFEVGSQKAGAPEGAGNGIYRSTDRGSTWTTIASTDPDNNADFRYINVMVSHPTDPKIIVAGTGRGLKISKDGGDTWNGLTVCLTPGNPLPASVHSVDFSKDGNVLYAGFSNGTFYRSEDYLTDCSFEKSDDDFVIANYTRMTISASPTDNDKVYIFEGNTDRTPKIHISIDGGKNWNEFNPPMPQSATHFDLFGQNPIIYNQLFKAVVSSKDPTQDNLFVGAVQLWRYDGNWTMASTGGRTANQHNSTVVHVDNHLCVQDPNNPSVIYFLNDGGVYKTLDGGYEFFDVNKGYQTSQYYSIDHANFDYAIGGTQDNGCIFVTPYRPGNPDYGAVVFNEGILNGDGFDCVISEIVDLKYTTAQEGNLGRGGITSRQGSGACEPYCGFSDFYSHVTLWESANDLTSRDYIIFKVDTTEDNVDLGTGIRTTFEGTIVPTQATAKLDYGSISIGTFDDRLIYDGNGGFTGNGSGTFDETTNEFKVTFNDAPALNARINAYYTVSYDAGDLIIVESATDNRPINHVLTTNLEPGDQVSIQDPIQSLVAMQTYRKCEEQMQGGSIVVNCETQSPGVIIARKAIILGTNPEWMHFALGNTREMVFSADGNELFYSANGRSIRRLKGLNAVYNQDQADSLMNTNPVTSVFSLPGQGMITNLSFNPNNPDEMIVTVGTYGVTDHVFLVTRNSTTDQWSFKNVQGSGLPDGMPVYDAIFAAGNGSQVILGTDLGIYSTNDIHATGAINWTKEDFGNIPVFDIDQQTGDHTKAANHGVIYLGTHGRGIWKSETLVGVEEIAHNRDRKEWEATLDVYPNPVRDNLNLNFTVNNAEDAQLQIFNLNGQMMQTIRPAMVAGENTVSISTSELPNGTYFVTLRDGNSQKVAKFVKIQQ
ncbi:T9SS type A sorting domain-containing protein [bacterium SCSIO 12741]|nr:T9SS type A sorting domain-containing protein [bacterium SCSIO 12741]